MRRNVRLATAARWAIGLMALTPCASPAVEYVLEPTVDLQAVYNDNIRMTSTGQESTTGIILSPRLNVAARVETWQLGIDARLRDKHYYGIKGFNNTDQIINLYSQYQTERNALQFGVGRTKDSILTGEYIDTDSGLVRTQVIRTNENANASWIWSLTEQDQIKLGYQYANVAYDNVTDVSLYDYSQHGPSATLTHIFSKRTQVFLQVDNSQFAVPKLSESYIGQADFYEAFIGGVWVFNDIPRNVAVKSSTNSIQAGINYAISETVTGNLSAGSRKTSSDTQSEVCTATSPPYTYDIIFRSGSCVAVATNTITTTTRGRVYNASLTKNTETLQLTAVALRSIDPSGSGTQVQNDTLKLYARWGYTEKLAYSLSGTSSKVHALESTSAVVDRRIYNVMPGLEWRAGRHSTLKLSYGYSRLSYSRDTDAIIARQVNLTYSYAWDTLSISH